MAGMIIGASFWEFTVSGDVGVCRGFAVDALASLTSRWEFRGSGNRRVEGVVGSSVESIYGVNGFYVDKVIET